MGNLAFVSAFYITLSYAAAAIFIGGLLYKIHGYAVTPSPLKIPTTPQPTTAGGVFVKNAINISTFSNLYKGNRWTWIGGYALHVIFLLVLIRHLRYFLEPILGVVVALQFFGMWAGILLPLPLIYLMVRRAAVDRAAYISSFADYFVLILILLTGLSGISLKILVHADIVAIKQFILGLMLFRPVDIPTHPAFLVHFTLVLILAVYFPFSKLMHAGGVFFSPTMEQVDNPREKKNVNSWAAD
ncbi:MAG: menaquinol oxidoreductase [bacterium]|nr:MAG: menaquinol oxidoreductase [bacterium]